MLIRQERAQDAAAIDAVLLDAFGEWGASVVDLVANLRSAGLFIPELMVVAEQSLNVVGFAGVSRVRVEGPMDSFQALNLSPLAVATAFQGKGIGKALIEGVLERLRDHPEPILFLEGDPGPRSLYRKYFTPLSDRLVAPDEELEPGAFQMRALSTYNANVHRGKVVYPQPFRDLATGDGTEEPASA